MCDVQTLYAEALESLIAKLRADTYVIAAVLAGSMAYDTVWEKSDIDVLLIMEETRQTRESICLSERGLNIHCSLLTRSQFRRILEGATQGSFVHSLLGKGRMLFSRDEPLAELFEARHSMGERDRKVQLLFRTNQMLPSLTKAEKWFHAKRDYDYCFLWLMKCIDSLASIELLLHGEVPSREVIQRALALNSGLFTSIYTDLIHADPSPAQLGNALKLIDTYLRDHIEELFGLVLGHLRDEGEVRSITDINHYFERAMNMSNVDNACEWLADEGFLEKMAVPARLTAKSRVDVQEAAYYYSGEQTPCASRANEQ